MNQTQKFKLNCPNCHEPFEKGKYAFIAPYSQIICRRVLGKKGTYHSCEGKVESPLLRLVYDDGVEAGRYRKVQEIKKVLNLEGQTD